MQIEATGNLRLYSLCIFMNSINIFVEIGKKKTFAGAVEWPGWCRSGRGENAALQSLIDYGPRYAQVLHSAGIEFQAPTDTAAFIVTEQHTGNATTDFGAPAIILDVDREPVDRLELARLQTLLQACWHAFDNAVQQATGRELRKGPRGGGGDLEKMLHHVLEADLGYLRRLAWKQKRGGETNLLEALKQTRQAILSALEAAAKGALPEKGPRGGVIWPPRYFVRRVAWHILDHAWEIEDRMV